MAIKRALQNYRHYFLRQLDTGSRVMVAVILVLLTGFLWFVLASENPWDREIFKKIAAEEKLSIRDTIVLGLWLAAAVNVVIALVMLLLSRWWARPLEYDFDAGPKPEWPPSQKAFGGGWFWVVVILAMGLAAIYRVPRLDHSFWNDEEQSMRKFTWGEHVAQPDGTLEWKPVTWERALFYTMSGNNHVVHTVGARWAHDIRVSVTGESPETFDEAAIRIPPLIAGLLTVAAVAVLLRTAGYPLAGLTAAFLLALNPWHLRYSVEARGYSDLLLWVVLTMIFLLEALRTGKWRWWIAYGLGQCLYLLSFAGAVYLAVAMNVLVAGVLFARHKPVMRWRWFAACALGAMIYLQLMGPAFARIWIWIHDPVEATFSLNAAYWKDLWSHLMAGIPWAAPAPELRHGITLTELQEASPVRAALLMWGMPLVAGLGTVLALWKCAAMRLPLLAILGALGLVVAHNEMTELAFYTWYLLYLAIALVVVSGLLPVLLAPKGSDTERSTRWMAPALCAVLVLSYGFATAKPRGLLAEYDRHPMRQAVLAVRGAAPALGAEQAEILTASVGSGANQFLSYDPRVQALQSAEELQALIEQARKEGRRLAVYCTSPLSVQAGRPEIFVLLEDPSMFEKGEYFKGQEEYWSIQVYTLKPPSGGG